MFRKEKTHIEYNKDGIEIRPSHVGEEYDIGNWPKYYDPIKLGYTLSTHEMLYSDISYVMVIDKSIVGYFIARREYKITHKELVLCDFAVDSEDDSLSKILFDYIISYSNYNGYNIISIQKDEKYQNFINFIKENYIVSEGDNYLHLNNEKPRIKSCQRYINVYENDQISYENQYFLYDLGFRISKTNCILKLKENEIIDVDRKTGIVTFPSNVSITSDKVKITNKTRNLILIIKSMFKYKNIADIEVNYSIEKDEYEAICERCIFSSKKQKELIDDVEYLFSKYLQGYNQIVPSSMTYNLNERSFTDSYVILQIDKLLKQYSENADSQTSTIIDRREEKKKSLEFNSKLDYIKRFEFESGTTFSGIRKFVVFFEEKTYFKSNMKKKNEGQINKEEFINELKLFNFSNWKEFYNSNPKPEDTEKWGIRLTLEDESIIYKGHEDYPNIWPLVKLVLNKYIELEDE